MGLNLEAKKQVVAELTAELKDAQSVVFAEYSGVGVSALNALRKQAREQGVYVRVVKNTLVRKAVADSQFKALSDVMSGHLIYGISKDELSAAKIFSKFQKEAAVFKLKAGYSGGQVLFAADLEELANIPDRLELIGRLLFVLQSPMAALARGLSAVAEQKQSA